MPRSVGYTPTPLDLVGRHPRGKSTRTDFEVRGGHPFTRASRQQAYHATKNRPIGSMESTVERTSPVSSSRSAACMYTGTSHARANAAAAPTWSGCGWVRRIDSGGESGRTATPQPRGSSERCHATPCRSRPKWTRNARSRHWSREPEASTLPQRSLLAPQGLSSVASIPTLRTPGLAVWCC